MNCKNCNNKLMEGAKFCNKCGIAFVSSEAQKVASVKTHKKGSAKKVFASIGGAVIIILAFGIARWVSYEGTIKVVNEFNENKTEQKVVNYFTDTSSWKEFNSPIGKFKATFPTYPSHETENLDIPDTDLTFAYDTYSSETSDGTSYVVNTAVYPSEVDTSNPEINLEGSLNGMLASNDGNKLISSNMTYFDSHRALDFLIQNDTFYLKGKIIMAGHTLYQLMAVYEYQNYNESDYNKFMNSFVMQ